MIADFYSNILPQSRMAATGLNLCLVSWKAAHYMSDQTVHRASILCSITKTQCVHTCPVTSTLLAGRARVNSTTSLLH